MNKKKIVFLTGTRADFGKIKSLIIACNKDENFEVYIFITGMHLNLKYGNTYQEIIKSGFTNIFMFMNHEDINHMDKILAKTVEGFSQYVRELNPDMIIVHGDRLEALAAAIVGAFNNKLVSHIEGGEISGTIDESIRHSVSKLSHFHFVSNEKAEKRLIQMGENPKNIFLIGSPDLDIILNNTITIEDVKTYYNIEYDNYAISIFHPVTTEFEEIEEQSKIYCKALVDSKKNYIVIYPNNDYGSDIIMNHIKKYLIGPNFKIFPSIRFEKFSILLKYADFIIGNSSVGVREAPYYPTRSINLGTRQNNRVLDYKSIVNITVDYESILNAIDSLDSIQLDNHPNFSSFGEGKSGEKFLEVLRKENTWNTSIQKEFKEL